MQNKNKSFHSRLSNILRHNRHGSFSTQLARRYILHQVGHDLKRAGYRKVKPNEVKNEHAQALVDYWKQKGLSAATIKNRLSHLRWLSKMNGRGREKVSRSNKKLGVENRVYITNKDKSIKLTPEILEKISNEYVRMSLKLQEAFGLRREEALKIKPKIADKGDRLVLQGSWCKGGRPREIPIITQHQRDLLEEAKKLAKHTREGSLIPGPRKYIQQAECFKKATQRAGIPRTHGLRHAYAQRRYHDLSGNLCPVAGGLRRREMTPEQREGDRKARLLLTEELGHSREDITSNYLGS